MTSSELFDTRPKVKPKLNILPTNPEPPDPKKVVGPGRFPSWLHRKLPKGGVIGQTEQILNENRLHTVCEEAKCPNLPECWSRKTATFLIMGKECTRSCGFCDIDFAKAPQPIDPEEPLRVADSVKKLGLKHVVITMVARDDLSDGGASHLVQVMEAIRQESPEVTLEVLTSDFYGNRSAWQTILEAAPTIFNHNIETVREHTPRVRHKATYERTLAYLTYLKEHRPSSQLLIKSGLMVGFGEKEKEVEATITDLHRAGCDIITIGQYLQASRLKLRVKEFVTPKQFQRYKEFGEQIGVSHMYCAPFVRSSYNADQVLQEVRK